MSYQFDASIQYSNDLEFRDCLRKVFKMTHKAECKDLDSVSNDENNYDTDAVFESMNYVYFLTKNEPLFMDMYEKAAAKMFSTDKNIGLSVLYSYDYFRPFHLCLRDFTNTDVVFDSNNVNYINLNGRL
jgi:hypothetical protein